MSTYRLKMPLRPSGDALGDDYNTAMEILDHLVQTSVTSETNTPAAAPLVGASYLVGSSPSGVWSGHAGEIAVHDGTDWDFIDPPTGMMIFDVAADSHKRWTGTAWVAITAAEAGSVTGYPSDFAGQTGKLLRVNSNSPEDGMEFVAVNALGLASEFTELTDAPANYTGSAGKLLRVNSNSPPDGLEFVSIATAIQPAVIPVTSTATAAGDGTIYTNEGDSDGATLTLPAAAAGLQVTAIVQAAQTFTVTAGVNDTIRLAANITAAGGSISSAVVGSVAQLVAINAADTDSSPDIPGEWIAVSIVGSWSI